MPYIGHRYVPDLLTSPKPACLSELEDALWLHLVQIVKTNKYLLERALTIAESSNLRKSATTEYPIVKASKTVPPPPEEHARKKSCRMRYALDIEDIRPHLPQADSDGRLPSYPFGKVEVGESFFIPRRTQVQLGQYRKLHTPKTFISIKVHEDWVRVWRTE